MDECNLFVSIVQDHPKDSKKSIEMKRKGIMTFLLLQLTFFLIKLTHITEHNERFDGTVKIHTMS